MNPVNISDQGDQLLQAALSASSGRAAHMVSGGPGTQLTQTVIALAADSRLDDHENPGEATVFVLRGSVELGTGDTVWKASAGQMITVPDERHHLSARAESVILLTSVKK